jgi:hypothetical protein
MRVLLVFLTILSIPLAAQPGCKAPTLKTSNGLSFDSGARELDSADVRGLNKVELKCSAECGVSWVFLHRNDTLVLSHSLSTFTIPPQEANYHITILSTGAASYAFKFYRTNNIVGVQERILDNLPKLLVYPDPAGDNVTIILHNNKISEITLRDLLGKTLTVPGNGEEYQVLSLVGIRSGIYFLSVESHRSVLISSKLLVR